MARTMARDLLLSDRAGNKTPIDLDLVEWKTQQIAERRIPGAKIIHCKLHAELMQPFQRVEISSGVFYENGFSNLKLKLCLAVCQLTLWHRRPTLTKFLLVN